MQKELKIQLEEQLLQARKNSLQEMQETTLRPHGKLRGMDVFSWYKPTIDLLINTFESFPFNVIWIGNANDISEVIEKEPSICAQLHAILTIDNPSFTLDTNMDSNIENVISTNNLSEALGLIGSLEEHDTIVLFTSSDRNWKETKVTFEQFVANEIK